MVKGVN